MGELLTMFFSFFKVGLFSIGGGYVAIPLIQSEVVDLHKWLTLNEFTDLVTIAEMTPGPIAINAATFVGNWKGGFIGSVVATFGCILPSLIIVSILAYVYYKYKNVSTLQSVLSSLRPAVVALIFSAGLTILLHVIFGAQAYSFSAVQWVPVGLFACAFFILRKFKLNPIYVMLMCGAASLLIGIVTGAV